MNFYVFDLRRSDFIWVIVQNREVGMLAYLERTQTVITVQDISSINGDRAKRAIVVVARGAAQRGEHAAEADSAIIATAVTSHAPPRGVSSLNESVNLAPEERVVRAEVVGEGHLPRLARM